MKYVNANDVLPEELISMIRKYYQGGYLYVPKENCSEAKRQTEYMIELEKRNQRIYAKRLEGRTNEELEDIYHLSAASMRRIVSKEKVKYQEMKDTIAQILPLWGIESRQLLQIHPSAWEINHAYVIKVYHDKKQLERNIRISEILWDCSIPVARILHTKVGEKYAECHGAYFLMTEKMRGSNTSDIKDQTIAWKMGCAIAQLHRAFIECEAEVEFRENSLLKEMRGWIREALANHGWKILSESEYSKTVESLESIYDCLPKQLIHRDVHFGNFLFFEGNLSGYIDFDLSQRNIRIFDICYFLTGLLAEETDATFTKEEWIEHVKSGIAGYESIIPLSEKEKNAIPCVMECVEILFIAYFSNTNDTKRAHDAYHAFRFIQDCESDIKNVIG